MTRNLAFFLALAAGILVASASAVSPSVWHPLASGFQSLTTGSVVPSQYGGPTARVAATLPPSPTPPKSGPSATPRPKPTARPTGGIGTVVEAAKGWATYQPGTGWWGSPSPRVYAWNVSRVRVCGPLACHEIQLRNECACGDRHGIPTLIDLAEPAWAALCGDVLRGVCSVTVSHG